MSELKKVLKDGKEVFTGTPNECFAWIHNHQGQSVDYALKWGGYAIRDAATEEETGRDSQ